RDGQRYVNPNDGFNPRVCLFVWMEGLDNDNALCRWIVRFRLCDSSGFLRSQDYYQLESLASALTGKPEDEAVSDFDSFQAADSDPLPRVAAVSRRLNACRDSYFAAADAIQQTTPSDPMVEKPKTYHAWAFKAEKPSHGYHLWDDCKDLEFLRFGTVTPIKALGSSLIDRLDYLHFTADLTVLTDGPDETLVKADTYEPMIDIEPTTEAGGYMYEEPGLLPSDGFSKAISYQLINWAIRRGYDQLAGLWNSAKSWGGSPFVPGPDFWCYWPVPVNTSTPYFDDDGWTRTNEIRGYWRALPYTGGYLRGTDKYTPVVLPKIKATPEIDKLIDFKHTSEVRIAEKIYGQKVTL
ncbi:hypothetical protein, partial [Limosilactobacillus coleohominis]|uniref:hypothetical protein n=1 Tax=Limosilactobacillus coleohominis TaxID=181675 RepID=UPI0026EDB871